MDRLITYFSENNFLYLPKITRSTDEEWEKEFAHYKESVEFKTVNKDIGLKGFKKIFFVEWFHRLCGSSLGVVFGLPFFYFLARGYFTRKMRMRLFGMLGLGGLQGLIGWWMVKSGINKIQDYQNTPRVSTYRLMVHNGMAMSLYSALLYHGILMLRKGDKASLIPKSMTEVGNGYNLVECL